MRLPVNRWDCVAKSLGSFLLLQRIGVVVDTSRFFQSGNTPTHVPKINWAWLAKVALLSPRNEAGSGRFGVR